MTISFHPAVDRPRADDLRTFEAEFGFDLPDDYRAFLLDYNGGLIQGFDAASSRTLGLGFYAEAAPPLRNDQSWIAPDSFWDVALFHGLLQPKGQYGDLREIYPVMRDWAHPAEMLPVASQAGGAKYFLCVAGSQRGHVLFAGDMYLEKQADGLPITPADYHHLAESFGTLLSGLVWREF